MSWSHPPSGICSIIAAVLFGMAPAPERYASQSIPDAFELRGVVQIEATRRVSANAVVTLNTVPSREVVTDSTGRFRFKDVPFGTYSAEARRVGYYSERREIVVRCTPGVVDSTGRTLIAATCDRQLQVLNFYLRPRRFQ